MVAMMLIGNINVKNDCFVEYSEMVFTFTKNINEWSFEVATL